jgi:hypothetical protein
VLNIDLGLEGERKMKMTNEALMEKVANGEAKIHVFTDDDYVDVGFADGRRE